MLHSRKNNNKSKQLYERCRLRFIYNHKKSSYESLSVKNNSMSVQHKNVQALAIEMFKVKHKLCLEISFLWKDKKAVQFAKYS